MKNIQNTVGFIFIYAVWILTFISILGVWKMLSSDVITKSYLTLGLLALVSVIIMAAGKFMEGRTQPNEVEIIVVPHPAFKAMRKGTLIVLIISVSFLAFLGILSIWEVITDKDVLYKTIGSLATLAFSSFLVVMTCLNREGGIMYGKDGKVTKISVAVIVVTIIIGYILLSSFRMFSY